MSNFFSSKVLFLSTLSCLNTQICVDMKTTEETQLLLVVFMLSKRACLSELWVN